MNPLEICAATQASFSDYLDGAVTGVEMQRIARHLEVCSTCAREFSLARSLQQTLATLAPVRPPEDLGRRLRVAISQERTRSWSAVRDRLQMRWENGFRPLLLQASAGLAGALVLLGSIIFLLGRIAAPDAVMANDEPLGAITAPHYLYSIAEPRAIRTEHDETIVVQARVNAEGRVFDYRIVAGPSNPEVENQVVEQLLASVFEPARVFGGPVRGSVIMTFAGISVKG